MKRFSALLALLGSLLLAVPALAFNIPIQGTDNATDVILWNGNTANVSVLSGNMTITIGDLQVAIEAGAENISNGISDTLGTFTTIMVILVFIFGLAVLAYWRNDKPIFLLAGLGFIVEGFTFISSSIYLCILMVLAGLFMFFRAFSGGKRAK